MVMKHALACAAVAGVIGGGLVVASAGTAMAKSDLTLNAAQKVIRAGQGLRLEGSAGDDAGIRKAVFCLQMRTRGERWRRSGHCVRPFRVGLWEADFRFAAGDLSRGRYLFRAVGIDPRHHHHAIYGPSAPVGVTVR